MRFSLPDCNSAKEYAQRIKPMPLSLLRQMREDRLAAAVELKEIEREIARRVRRMQPRKVIYVSWDDDTDADYKFEIETTKGRRRVLPRGVHSGEMVCQPSELIRVWLKRLKVTHVESKFGCKKTDEATIKDGVYTVAQYIKWWKRCEEDE